MARFAFVGPSYRSQSVNADCQLTQNWYPEIIESQQGKSLLAMYPTPGLKLACALQGEVEVLGVFEFNGRAFAAGDHRLFEITYSGVGFTATPIGTFTGGPANGQPVCMTANQANQLLVAAGGNLYIYKLDANVFIPVDMTQLKGPVDQVAFADTYFVAMIRNSNTFQISNLLNGFVWLPTLDASKIAVFPENVVSMNVAFREIWFLGRKRSAAYYNTGALDFPFSPIPSGYMEQGAIAQWAACLMDNTGFWIGGDERGFGIGWKANGYTPQRVTTHAVEYAWSQYPRIDDAISYAYQDQGHTFWVIYFPSASKTWVYDAATNMWHERAFLDSPHGRLTAHRSRCHMVAFGKHLVGDWATGSIYDMSINNLDDFGNPIQRVRRGPHIANENEWMLHFSLEVMLESGATPQSDIIGFEPFTTFVIADSTGVLWAVRVKDTGNLTTTVIPGGGFDVGPFDVLPFDTTTSSGVTPQTIIINDPTDSTSWRLGVVPVTGNLFVTPVTSGGFDVGPFDVIPFDSGGVAGNYPQSYRMVSTSGTKIFNLQVSITGILQTLPQGNVFRDPQVSLRWSNDGGHTWSNYYTRGIGRSGQFKKRVIWWRLGRARDRVYELSTADAFPARVIDAYLKAKSGGESYAPTERIGDKLRKMA